MKTLSLLSILVDSAIKGSVIVLLALAATALLRRRSAAVRHWVLSATIVCAAAMPALGLLAPSWRVPIGTLAAGGLEPLPASFFTPLASAGERSDVFQERRASFGRILKDQTDDGPVAAMARWLVPVWAAGVALSLAVLVIGLGRLRWLASRARVVDGRWAGRAAAMSAKYGLRRRVLLLESDHPTLLVTWGIMRPKVMLPRGSSAWTDDRVQVVLGHELGHIRRHDWVWHMAAQLVRCAYWFNPLVWLACKRLRLESERACDDAVLNLGVQGPDYATHLLDLAQAARQHRASLLTGSAALAIARPSSLEGRITAMLNARLNRSSVTRSVRVVTALAVLAAAVTIAGFTASAQTVFATFSGSVFDSMDGVLPDATLILTNLQSTAKHEIRSDAAGRFEFVGLPPADYSLETRLTGFATFQGRLTMTGQHVQQNVRLQIGGIEETVTVDDREDPPAVMAPVQRRPWDPASCTTQPTGGHIKQPYALTHQRPEYPLRLRGTGTAGVVVLDGRIGTDGFMNNMRIVGQAQPDLANAAFAAIEQWQYSETLLDCIPVEVVVRVTVKFVVAKNR